MIGWVWFALCQLFAVVVLFPCGVLVVGLACFRREWTLPASSGPRSIKPLAQRPVVDTWAWGWMQPFYGNPEDGVTGRCAYGSWAGAFNPGGSRWTAFVWSGLRNWANGFAYLTWRWETLAPNLQVAYTVPAWVPRMGGTRRMLRLGWQQLPAADGWVGPYTCRMVCSF